MSYALFFLRREETKKLNPLFKYKWKCTPYFTTDLLSVFPCFRVSLFFFLIFIFTPYQVQHYCQIKNRTTTGRGKSQICYRGSTVRSVLPVANRKMLDRRVELKMGESTLASSFPRWTPQLLLSQPYNKNNEQYIRSTAWIRQGESLPHFTSLV